MKDVWLFMSQLRRSFLSKRFPFVEWLFILPSLLLLALLALPILALLWRAGAEGILLFVSQPSAIAALHLSLVTSSLSVLIAIFTGTPLAFVLARRKFIGKTILELMIDLPIVLPPSVAGIALLIAFGRQGMFGSGLSSLGIHLPFTTAAVVLAQTFVSAPLFVRAARIGFAEIDHQIVEAAYVEGSNEWQLFRFLMFPLAARAILSGAILAWTRAIGEFGAIVIVAGNIPLYSQTAAVYVLGEVESENRLGASAVSIVMVTVAFSLILLVDWLQHRNTKGTL